MKTRSPFLKKNRLAGLALAIVSALTISMVAQATIGDLDPTFGAGGKVTTFVGNSNSDANAAAVQADGKIVVAGIPLLVRYNNDGSLDTTFGTNGIVNVSGIKYGVDVAIQPDGKILVTGQTNRNSVTFAVARLNSNGSVDTRFGSNGIASRPSCNVGANDCNATVHSIALGPNGKILVAGGDDCCQETSQSFDIVSYNSDGSFDAMTTLYVGHLNYLTTLVIQPDSKILLVGNSDPSPYVDYGDTSISFMRVSYATDPSDGTTHLLPDSSLGGNGGEIPSFGSAGFIDYAAALQKDGKIVAVGEYGCPLNYYDCLINGGGYKFSLARFNSDGSLDTSFATNGLSITNISDSSDEDDYQPSRSDKLLVIQPDGKIVAAGDTSDGHFFLARFNSNGSLDTTFGTNGEITTAFGTSDDHLHSIVLQSDGKIIAAGSTSNGTNTGIALARYVVANVKSVTATFISEGANDGTILESYQNSGVGATQNGFATTISVGDDPGNRQYRSILSFHTQSIPDNAVITAAQLMIRYQGTTVGTDPVPTFGNLLVDIHSGYFGNSIGLELADFSAPASPSTYQEHLSPMPYNWYGTNLSTASNLELINKFGWTQFRLRFALPSNKNNISDYDKFYSGEGPTGSQPQLIVTYYVP